MFTRQQALEVAITTAYLYSGFNETSDDHPELMTQHTAWADVCGGDIGVVEALAEFALVFEEAMLHYREFDYPGVLAYEIIEPLGVWLRECAAPPADNEFLSHLHETLSAWFGVGNPMRGVAAPPPQTPVRVVPRVSIEDWKDRVSAELFARYEVSIDDIGLTNDQLMEHLAKSPAEFADWWGAQKGTV